jgi:hypothetical protein
MRAFHTFWTWSDERIKYQTMNVHIDHSLTSVRSRGDVDLSIAHTFACQILTKDLDSQRVGKLDRDVVTSTANHGDGFNLRITASTYSSLVRHFVLGEFRDDTPIFYSGHGAITPTYRSGRHTGHGATSTPAVTAVTAGKPCDGGHSTIFIKERSSHRNISIA